MFDPVSIPFGAKMLFNTVKLKPGVDMDDVELALGEMCNVVKDTYGGDKGGFIAGQVFKFSGFVSDEGSLAESRTADAHIAIVTYWRSFEEHEKSHADCGVPGQVQRARDDVHGEQGAGLRPAVAGRAGVGTAHVLRAGLAAGSGHCGRIRRRSRSPAGYAWRRRLTA